MAVMLAYFKVPLTWGQILRRTFDEAFIKDNCLGMAAQLAYYFFFALFPALLTFISFASFFPIDDLTGQIVTVLGRFAPPEVITIIKEQIRNISESGSGGILTFGFLLTLWSSSGAMGRCEHGVRTCRPGSIQRRLLPRTDVASAFRRKSN